MAGSILYFPAQLKKTPLKAKPTDKENPKGTRRCFPVATRPFSPTRKGSSHVSYAHTVVCLPEQSLPASKEHEKRTVTALDWIRSGAPVPFPPPPSKPTPGRITVPPSPDKPGEKGGA